MSSTGGNPEVAHKTYHLQTNNTTTEQSLPNRQSTTKVSNHQPSRKTSVHDVQEATRDDLNKVRLISSNRANNSVGMFRVDRRRDS